MAKINPVNFPIIGDATNLNVFVLNFPTYAKTCTLYYNLSTDTNVKCLEGNYDLTAEEFDLWGYDNSYLDNLIATRLEVTIIQEEPITEVLPEENVLPTDGI